MTRFNFIHTSPKGFTINRCMYNSSSLMKVAEGYRHVYLIVNPFGLVWTKLNQEYLLLQIRVKVAIVHWRSPGNTYPNMASHPSYFILYHCTGQSYCLLPSVHTWHMLHVPAQCSGSHPSTNNNNNRIHLLSLISKHNNPSLFKSTKTW